MKIFGIVGKAQTGKDSLGNHFVKVLPNLKVQKMSFAKPLKDFLHEYFSIPKKNLWGSDAEKNYPLCTWSDIFTDKAIEAYNKTPTTLLSTREILQVVGTDVMRQDHLEYLPDDLRSRSFQFIKSRFPNATGGFQAIWTQLMGQDINNTDADVVVVPDVRFFNEINMLEGIDAVLIRLYRNIVTANSIPHPSELEMEQMGDDLFHHILYEHENKNLDQLRAFGIRILMQEGLVNNSGVSV